MEIIKILVRNKIVQSPKEKVICGNDDYYIKFDFDAEWDDYPMKTAIFTVKREDEDEVRKVSFEGCLVKVPVMKDTIMFYVGVTAGVELATTPGLVGCKYCILCGGGDPDDEDDNDHDHDYGDDETPDESVISEYIDDTLSKPGYAADAKAVGDALADTVKAVDGEIFITFIDGGNASGN